MRRDERARFDAIFEEVLESLPPRIHALIEEVPVALEDHPPRSLLAEMGIDPDDRTALCGVHSGVPLTKRSVDRHELPDTVTLFREDGFLEVFALTWSPATSYQFVACFTPFEVQANGSIKAVPSVPTIADLVVTSTTPGGESLTPTLKAPFLCSSKLVLASVPQTRSRLLQTYVEGGLS